jgi:hypothetical protein
MRDGGAMGSISLAPLLFYLVYLDNRLNPPQKAS